ncbi:MAG: putative tungstate transport system substrate-binding protein [Nocardioidaceae bacterium]|nr:putative tungstate transport system substrate-binding protein [Nocardioidaceae bacterium]
MPVNTRLRRAAATLAAGLLVAGLVDATLPASSTAADPILQIQGTSDVSDSGLLNGAAGYLHNPILNATGVNVNYTGSATGTAINNAKIGLGSMLLVHAASVENQFVDQGFSQEEAGRSLMWGDFVLAGNTSDPAHTLVGGTYNHDIVKTFHDVAVAGAAGNAHFVNRVGAPGTTVQEHAIWALVNSTYGDVTMCTVSDADGGGMRPSTTTGACAASTQTAPYPYPTWYSAGDRKQAANIQFANVCAIPNSPGSTTDTSTTTFTDCYVFTDRGTLLNLQTIGSTAANLTTVTRNNAASAPGGFEALVNAFHAYVINPDKVPPGSNLDPVAAKKVLDYLTSPAGQQVISGYLATDPPFLPAASAVVTTTQSVPGSTVGATPFTVAGHLANPVPGYPKLDNLPINLMAVPTSNPSAAPAVVASGASDASGNFALSYTPSVSMTYSLSVPTATRVEVASLSPQFKDILTGITKNLGVSSVGGSFNAKVLKNHKGRKLRVKGALNPQVTGNGATLVLYRAKQGKKHALKPVASKPLAAGATSYSLTFKFKKGKWKYVLIYQNPGVITPVATGVRKVTFH